MHRILILVLIVLSSNGCKQRLQEDKAEKSKTGLKTINQEMSVLDSLPNLLKRSIYEDSVGFEEMGLLFYSGNFFNIKNKHAMLLKSIDAKTLVEIYFSNNGNWSKVFTDTTDIGYSWVSPGIELADMNFDQVDDILVTRSISNGIAMKAQHLYIYKDNYTFLKIPEADSLFNLTAENNKTVTAMDIIWCKGIKNVALKQYKWKGDRLMYTKTDFPCEPDGYSD